YSLKLHLMAVGQFEKQDKTDKRIKHMNGFKSLIDHQYENDMISEEAHRILESDADDLILTWDSLLIVQDGEAHAVVVISDEDAGEAADTLVTYVQESTGVELTVLIKKELENGYEAVR